MRQSLMLMVVWLAVGVDAAEIHFASQRGPYYVGEPVVVQVVVQGLEAGPDPACRLRDAAPDGLTIHGPQVSQSSRSFTRIINGRVSSSESRDYRFSFTVTAEREGEYLVGPFEVTVGSESRIVEGERFAFGQLENDPDMRIEWSFPQRVFYVGQEVPVTVRWSYAGELPAVQYAFSNLQIRSPLFDRFPWKEPPRHDGTRLQISTAKGTLHIPAEVRQVSENGRDVVVVEGRVTLVADAIGQHEDISISCRSKKVTQWGRSFFGEATARETAPALAAGEAISLVVKPIPLARRPPSFSGAVGEGFSLDVAANRSVVRVGDPISLTISLRGDGNLESVSLPDLSANTGLSDHLFQLPAEQPTGSWDGTTRQFQVTIRVKDVSVSRIPPIAFSWFDPVQEQFVTGHSKPIALQVLEAHVITADDVVSSPGTARRPEALPATDVAATEHASPNAGMSFVGANLAIERDVAALRQSGQSGWSARAVTAVGYVLAVGAILGGILARRRAKIDPKVVARRKRLRALRRQIDAAASAPPRDAAEQLAQVLRALIAEFQPPNRSTLEQVLAQCETRIYAVGGSSHEPFPDHAIQDAVEQARITIKEVSSEL